jgi:hypothetical protein
MFIRAWVAQLVEQWIENPCVGGSIPSPGTKLKAPEFGGLRLWRDGIEIEAPLPKAEGDREGAPVGRLINGGALAPVRARWRREAPEEGIPSPGAQ